MLFLWGARMFFLIIYCYDLLWDSNDNYYIIQDLIVATFVYVLVWKQNESHASKPNFPNWHMTYIVG